MRPGMAPKKKVCPAEIIPDVYPVHCWEANDYRTRQTTQGNDLKTVFMKGMVAKMIPHELARYTNPL